MKIIQASFICVLFTACAPQNAVEEAPEETGNPEPVDILESSPEADILYYNRIVYSNATDLEHYDIDDYEKGELLGEIKNTSADPHDFDEWTASVLPEGTELYAAEEGHPGGVIIADTGEEEILYHPLIEG
ncbi:hypothetical protein [Alkalicoccus saliphilus]|uniref:LTD domain-containing protein n=1 Tax=Alkalicoccus saliphilus TaxID=200989 RepID=A0A2T4U381_9BACI|nr:hypothetical protein [Alkalicoccus saliphilus]PTL37864.1 hypothetical protein C6Y45_14415 [Alkalicoccus saliphilus]